MGMIPKNAVVTMAVPNICKPDNFSGERHKEFPIWLARFETMCKSIGWEEEANKLKALPVSLAGEVFKIYNKLALDQKNDYK